MSCVASSSYRDPEGHAAAIAGQVLRPPRRVTLIARAPLAGVLVEAPEWELVDFDSESAALEGGGLTGRAGAVARPSPPWLPRIRAVIRMRESCLWFR